MDGVPDELTSAAEFIAPVARLQELASAADAVRSNPGSASARQRLTNAANALDAVSKPDILDNDIEAGPLQPALDEAIDARTAYADGTLRQLRTLEGGLLASWSGWLRWMGIRNALVLTPILTRFRKPFVDSLRGLVGGTFTGFAVEGIELGQQASVGTVRLITVHPASMAASLAVLRPGQAGVIEGPRSTAALLLGLEKVGDKLALGVAPLRVSVANDGESPPGIVPSGLEVKQRAGQALSAPVLRRGGYAQHPGDDGLVHQAISLWSRLRLVFGRALIDAEAGAALIPTPSTAPLESLTLYGSIPQLARVLVIGQLGDAYWDRTGDEPEPRLARPGEMILLRGWAEETDQEAAGLVQAPLEVDQVYRTTGSMLARMDLSAAAQLSTAPLPTDDAGEPCMLCGPEEDVAVVLLSQTWMRRTLTSQLSLRRDFLGFDLPSLATDRLLPYKVLDAILGTPISEPANLDRQQEFVAARETLNTWLKYGADQ